jgi:hypothetical protein
VGALSKSGTADMSAVASSFADAFVGVDRDRNGLGVAWRSDSGADRHPSVQDGLAPCPCVVSSRVLLVQELIFRAKGGE